MKDVKGCIGCTLLLVVGMIILGVAAFQWQKHQKADDMARRHEAGPANWQADRLMGTCQSEPKRWQVKLIATPTDPSAPPTSVLLVLTRSGQKDEPLLMTPSNDCHTFPEGLAEGCYVDISSGPKPFGQIFSTYACDYLDVKVVKGGTAHPG